MLDDTWRFGADDASIAESIRTAVPEAGMPPFGGALTDQEVRAMVIFIREERAKFRRSQASIPKPEGDAVVQSERHAFRVETITRGVKEPWSVAFLPDGRMLVTEKAGPLRIVQDGHAPAAAGGGIPRCGRRGRAACSTWPSTPTTRRTAGSISPTAIPGEGDSAMTAVVRGKLRDGQFVEQQEIFKAPPQLYRTGPVHFGSRFVFDGKGHLFFSIGERGQMKDAQDLSRPERQGAPHLRGRPRAAGQPVREQGRRVPHDLELRQPQPAGAGAASRDRRALGGRARPARRRRAEPDRARQELRLAGDHLRHELRRHADHRQDGAGGMEQPIIHWTPSIAVCAIDFYVGDRFPGWRHDLLVGALAQQEVRRVVIKGRKVTHQEVLFSGAGRVRDVVVGPDGYVYIAFNGPDRVARLVPVAAGTR
jgi:aldose sugar dehydrogenase